MNNSTSDRALPPRGPLLADVRTADQQFEEFVATNEPRLRRAFVAAYGSERGREATAESFAYAWENWHRILQMDNAVGYLYRVGQSRTRTRKSVVLFNPPAGVESTFEPKLIPALQRLTEHQRTAVVLVYGYGWTLREVAELTGVKVTTVQNHLERGLRKLRTDLEGGMK